MAPEAKAERRSRYQAARSDLTKEQLRTIAEHGPGAYKLAGADKSHRRVSQAFHHANAPYQWHDQRTVRCKAMLSNGTICNSGFSILSGDHLNEEIERLRNHNGVLDGPACGACGTRFLARPDEFSLNGAHQRTKDRNGKPIKNTGAPKAVRVLHKPCKGSCSPQERRDRGPQPLPDPLSALTLREYQGRRKTRSKLVETLNSQHSRERRKSEEGNGAVRPQGLLTRCL